MGSMRKHSPRRPLSRRPRLEMLEERCVLDAGSQLLITTITGAIQTVKLDSGADVSAALVDYQSKDGVAAAEVDQTVRIQATPDDTSYGSLYAMNNTGQSNGTVDADIDAPEAWSLHTGTSKVAVGVIDTGIDYTHKDLYLNIWLNQGEIPSTLSVVDTDNDKLITFYDLNNSQNSSYVTDINKNGYIDAGDLLKDTRWANGSDNDNNGYKDDLIGWDFVNNDNDPMDDNGHGTHVSGTIGAIGNNTLGVVGVNWRVQIAALKFLGADGSGYTSGAVSALNYSVGEGIQITNNSWGGGGYSSTMATAISNAQSAGYIFVAAAGNNSSNNDTTANYPSNYDYDNVLAVASTDRNDNLSSFSNYGKTTVDLAAPGSSILSTTPNNTYSTYSGTSMATPHVAGAVALLWSYDSSLSYSDVIARLKNTVDAKDSLTGKVATGGRLNLYNALSASNPTDTSGPRVTSVVANGTASVSSLRVTFSEAINANSFKADDLVSFSGPNGTISLTGATVTQVSSTQFDIGFTKQTTAGTYQLKFGPNITDSAGNAMDQNQNGTKGESADTYTAQFTISATFSNNTAVTIKDRSTVSSKITIADDFKISDLNVQFNITHTYDQDLYIYLVGPDGTRVDLVKNRGGSGDNFTNTILDDEASTALSSAAAPFNSTYRADGALSSYDTKSAKGTWTLYVADQARYDTGTLKSWSLIFTPSASKFSVVEGGDASEVAPMQQTGSAAVAVTGDIAQSIDQAFLPLGTALTGTRDPLQTLAGQLAGFRLEAQSPGTVNAQQQAINTSSEVVPFQSDELRQSHQRQESRPTASSGGHEQRREWHLVDLAVMEELF